MKKFIITISLTTMFISAYSQSEQTSRWSYSVHGIFQAFKVPFAAPSVYLRNKGLSFSAIYNLSQKTTFQQNFEVGYFCNKYQGNTYSAFTSTSFNPLHSKSLSAGLSLGAGYMNSGFSDGGWEQNEKGEWTETSNRRGNLFIPADLHLRFKVYESDRLILSPVIAYQLNALMKYSHATFILPQSMIKVGVNLGLK